MYASTGIRLKTTQRNHRNTFLTTLSQDTRDESATEQYFKPRMKASSSWGTLRWLARAIKYWTESWMTNMQPPSSANQLATQFDEMTSRIFETTAIITVFSIVFDTLQYLHLGIIENGETAPWRATQLAQMTYSMTKTTALVNNFFSALFNCTFSFAL